MTVLLRDAVKPNLLQTLENTPALPGPGWPSHLAHRRAHGDHDEDGNIVGLS
jgi:formyltetrahydrofolate synthetase